MKTRGTRPHTQVHIRVHILINKRVRRFGATCPAHARCAARTVNAGWRVSSTSEATEKGRVEVFKAQLEECVNGITARATFLGRVRRRIYSTPFELNPIRISSRQRPSAARPMARDV